MSGPGADDPPPASGLQAERTGLAWARTGLTACVAALALSRLAGLRGEPALAVVALLAATVSLGTFLEGAVRHGRRRDWLDDPSIPRAVPAVARWVVGAVVAVAAAGIWLVAVT
ncbi:DUF202 domain-containing protein [Egicoccus sp. AB-alg2]|uniref:DUF202 domain-containing protein n=1 Tax=Egicoccus sp. AB-alg2 TaxID=3242693 RepID=UPI00359EF683